MGDKQTKTVIWLSRTPSRRKGQDEAVGAYGCTRRAYLKPIVRVDAVVCFVFDCSSISGEGLLASLVLLALSLRAKASSTFGGKSWPGPPKAGQGSPWDGEWWHVSGEWWPVSSLSTFGVDCLPKSASLSKGRTPQV